jgi:hypothetical protein
MLYVYIHLPEGVDDQTGASFVAKLCNGDAEVGWSVDAECVVGVVLKHTVGVVLGR